MPRRFVPIPAPAIRQARDRSKETMESIYYTGKGEASALTAGHVGDATSAIRYAADAYPDEPLFVIRGRDIFARDVIHFYADAVAHIPGMYDQVMEHRKRFMDFARQHEDQMKWPDPYPGWTPTV